MTLITKIGRATSKSLYILFHLSPLALIWIETQWWHWALCLIMYVGRMFFVTSGYHRYFSHRSFKTSRIFQFILALGAVSSVQRGVLWWASHHRLHHRYSDTEKDAHSPTQKGFWWSHVGWIFAPAMQKIETTYIPDLLKFKELILLDRFHWVPPAILGGVIWLTMGFSAFVVGFLISTVLLWHCTYTINSLAHVFGKRRYPTRDTSRNNWFLSIITMGEGWHNNHHYYGACVRQGFYWWEIDITYYLLKMLSWVGLVWDLKAVPKRVYLPENQLIAQKTA